MLEEVILKYKNKDSKNVLVVHDWGSFISYFTLSKNPKIVEKIISFDIGAPDYQNRLFTTILVLYQNYFRAGYLVYINYSERIGNFMIHLLMPFLEHPKNPQNFSAGGAYIYHRSFEDDYEGLVEKMGNFRPQIPMLYIYGASKPVQFHSQSWIEDLPKVRLYFIDYSIIYISIKRLGGKWSA